MVDRLRRGVTLQPLLLFGGVADGRVDDEAGSGRVGGGRLLRIERGGRGESVGEFAEVVSAETAVVARRETFWWCGGRFVDKFPVSAAQTRGLLLLISSGWREGGGTGNRRGVARGLEAGAGGGGRVGRRVGRSTARRNVRRPRCSSRLSVERRPLVVLIVVETVRNRHPTLSSRSSYPTGGRRRRPSWSEIRPLLLLLPSISVVARTRRLLLLVVVLSR